MKSKEIQINPRKSEEIQIQGNPRKSIENPDHTIEKEEIWRSQKLHHIHTDSYRSNVQDKGSQ